MPEISFASFKHSFSEGEMNLKQLGLHFNTAIYIFDLASDCNCPTFSKDGNTFGKGFFLEVSPGVSFLSNRFAGEAGLLPYYPKNSVALGGSLGAGLDIGLTDLFDYPLARFFHYPSLKSIDELRPAGVEETSLSQLFIGLRFRIHFKEMAKARYR
ncbi:MAG: hypothetical protein IPN76_10775 [Saprospiraceae bacterium]|nr:hypothetical protein [Saprospiraceae bacterium]